MLAKRKLLGMDVASPSRRVLCCRQQNLFGVPKPTYQYQHKIFATTQDTGKLWGFCPQPLVKIKNKKIRNCPGCGFARPEIANSTYAKTFYPHGLRPWDWEWEEPAWHHARFAIVMPWKKQQGSALQPAGERLLFLLGRNGHDGAGVTSPDPLLLAPDPFSSHIAHRTRHNLGSYYFYLVTMGSTAQA